MRAGIREVRDNFSRYIAKVRRGTEIVITDRGKDVAVLRPARKHNEVEDWLDQLEQRGLVERPEEWHPIRARPHRLKGKLLSEIVREERRAGW